MTETTAQRRKRRQNDTTSAALLRVVHEVEGMEGRWLALPEPLPNGERGKTTAYLARTAAHLRFVRTLYESDVLTRSQALMMSTAAQSVLRLCYHRLDALGYTPDDPTPHASVGG